MDLNPLMVFSDPLAITPKGKSTAPTAFDKEAARTLRVLATEMQWAPRGGPKDWADQFRLLRQSGVKQETIATTLAAYAAGVKAGTVTKPKCRSGAEFRKHWGWVTDIVAKLAPPASHRATEIARLSTLTAKWPKVVTADQVAGFAQQVISFAEALLDKAMKERKRLEAKKPKTAADRVLMQALGTVAVRVGGADGYAKRHLEHVRDEVRKWKDWSGNLSMYVPSLTNKAGAFKRFALDSGISEETWTRVKEVLK